jgi:cation/acetate symporter
VPPPQSGDRRSPRVSWPLGFLGAHLGTLIAGRDVENEQRFDAFLRQVHTGVVPK